MSKELVKRLRNFDDGVTPTQEAADCIEALTAERDMATEGWAEATRLIDVARQQYGAEKSRAEAAEAKLAKAVEALGIIKDRQYYRMGPGITAQVIARAIIAEIKGAKE